MNPVLKIDGKQYDEKTLKSCMLAIRSCFMSTYYTPGTLIRHKTDGKKE